MKNTRGVAGICGVGFCMCARVFFCSTTIFFMQYKNILLVGYNTIHTFLQNGRLDHKNDFSQPIFTNPRCNRDNRDSFSVARYYGLLNIKPNTAPGG